MSKLFGILLAVVIVSGVQEVSARETVKQGTANVNGTKLYYEVKGRGFPLVFISSGGLLDRRCWDDQFEIFAKKFRVIRYDVRGIGKSARPVNAFSHSQDLYDLLDFLKIKRAHVVGLSVGGAIAIDFAIEHPEIVDHLILVAPGLSNDSKAEAMLQSLAAISSFAKSNGLDRVIQLTLDQPFVLSKENASSRERVRQIYLDNHDLFESGFPLFVLWQPTQPSAEARLGEIRARVLIVRGDKDSPIYSALTEKISRGIIRSKTVVIPGGTHFLNLEKPEEFNKAVMQFLQ